MAFTSCPTGPNGAEDFIDTTGAAEYLSMGRPAVVVMIRDGRLPAFRLGQRWVIRRADVEAWARDHPGDGRRGARRVATGRAHLRALAVIGEHPGITVAELAEHMGEGRRRALGRLQDLEHDALIRRDPGAKHTLPYRCFITDAGRERLAEPSMAQPA